jgi:ribosomal protein S18 acetylase RimI-like enzyme
MAELKKFRVRQAKPRDVGLFKSLWSRFLAEQEGLGSIIRGSERNLEIYTSVFSKYVNIDPDTEKPEYEGIVLFISEIAVVMAGDNGVKADLTIGQKPANVFGLYVAPDQRGKNLGAKLYEECFKKLKDMGFDAVFGDILNDNIWSENTLKKAAGEAVRVSVSPVYAKLSNK